jgi:hypothetical protein
MIESYQALSIEQPVDVNKCHHTKKKKKSLIITLSATDIRSHIQKRWGSSVWRCGMRSDMGHGSRQHHSLKLVKTGLIRAQLLSTEPVAPTLHPSLLYALPSQPQVLGRLLGRPILTRRWCASDSVILHVRVYSTSVWSPAQADYSAQLVEPY